MTTVSSSEKDKKNRPPYCGWTAGILLLAALVGLGGVLLRPSEEYGLWMMVIRGSILLFVALLLAVTTCGRRFRDSLQAMDERLDTTLSSKVLCEGMRAPKLFNEEVSRL